MNIPHTVRFAIPALLFALLSVYGLSGCGNSRRSVESNSSRTIDANRLDPNAMADAMTNRMSERLNLNDGQKTHIHAINLRYAQEMRSLASSSGSKYSKMFKMRDMQSRKDGELKAILDSGQYRDYQLLKDEMKTMMRERMNQRR